MKANNDTASDKIMFGIIIFLIALLLGESAMIYELRLNIKEIKDIAENAVSEVELQKLENKNIVISMSENISDVKIAGIKISEQLSLLEESISPRNHRWARIKKVRDVIYEVGRTPLTIETRTSIASSVVDASEEFDVPANLILAVMKQESEFNRYAVSPKEAKGLMQVMDPTAEEVNGWLNSRHYEWNKPKYNVRVGVAYLARMKFRFNDSVEMAIQAYNAGPTYVENVNAGIWKDYLPETKEYLPKVLKNREKFIELGVAW